MQAGEQRAPTGAAGRLEFAWLELTHACNLRCEQCYTHSTPDTPHRSLPTARWLELLDEIVAAGGVAVQFTGGEATAHPDWRRLLEHATHRGLSVELFTNGTTLGDSDLELLGRLGVSLAISLHSHDPAVHDAVTRVEGSFVATLETIRRACERGIHLRVATVLMESNAGDGPRVEALVRRQGVLTPLTVDAVRPTGRGRTATQPGDGPACTACRSTNYAAFHASGGNQAQATCWDGKLAISPDGVVTPCIFSRSAPMGNVAETPLPRVLAEGALAKLWALTVDDVEACRGCDRKAHCFDCRALPLSVLGDVRAKNPRCDYQPGVAPPDLPPETSLGLSPGLEDFRCGEGRLLLDRPTGKVHALNRSASLLLEVLLRGESVAEATAALVAETGASAETIRADLESTRQAMVGLGLLGPAAEADPRGEARWPIPPGKESPEPGRSLGGGLPRLGEGEGGGGLFALPQLRGAVYLEASASAWESLSPWLGPHLVEPAGEQPILGWIQVHSRRSDPSAPERHYVLVDGIPEGDALFPGALRSLVETAWCALAGSGGPPTFHAAAVRGEAGAVLMPGPSGTGKSLLCAHAVAAGAAYLSDELASWELDSGRVRGLPKPVTVKGEGERLLPPQQRLDLTPIDPRDPDEQRWLSLPAGAPAPIRAVVLPDRGGREGLSALDSTEGAAALLQSCFDLSTLGREEIEALIAACQGTPIFSLGTRDLAAAGEALASLAHTPGAG